MITRLARSVAIEQSIHQLLQLPKALFRISLFNIECHQKGAIPAIIIHLGDAAKKTRAGHRPVIGSQHPLAISIADTIHGYG